MFEGRGWKTAARWSESRDGTNRFIWRSCFLVSRLTWYHSFKDINMTSEKHLQLYSRAQTEGLCRWWALIISSKKRVLIPFHAGDLVPTWMLPVLILKKYFQKMIYRRPQVETACGSARPICLKTSPLIAQQQMEIQGATCIFMRKWPYISVALLKLNLWFTFQVAFSAVQ